MKLNRIYHSVCLVLPLMASLSVFAHQNDYNVSVSKCPFSNKLKLTDKQLEYSQWWKDNIQEQLIKPVNFAGHYRIFVSKGGHGKECVHDYWICGWVIDKSTGSVVSTLPRSPEGGDSYAEAVDDGTPEGVKFSYTSEKYNTILIIKGRAVNAPLRDKQGKFSVPECRLIKYNFDGSDFTIIKEDDNGCNLPQENEIYGK